MKLLLVEDDAVMRRGPERMLNHKIILIEARRDGLVALEK